MTGLFHRLLMGYVFHPDGQLDTVTWSSFELAELGEDGVPPKEFKAKFTAGTKKGRHLLFLSKRREILRSMSNKSREGVETLVSLCHPSLIFKHNLYYL